MSFATLTENTNPNLILGDLNACSLASKTVPDDGRQADCPISDRHTELIDAIEALRDGQVAVVGDLVAVRAGPGTFHPIKAMKGMASERDVVVLSCLNKSPAEGEPTAAVRSVLQRVMVRPTSAAMSCFGLGGRTSRGTANGAAPAGHAAQLRGICPSAHSAIVDVKLMRAFTPARARTILAGLTSLSTGEDHEASPTIVTGVTGGAAGLCFIGQRSSKEGYSAFTIRRASSMGVAQNAPPPRIDDLLRQHGGGRCEASARAVYDLWGSSGGDLLDGCLRDGADLASLGPFARLAADWDCSSHGTRALGSPPPPASSAVLLVGGACPSDQASRLLRGKIENLSTAARWPLPGEDKGVGPFEVGERDGRDSNDGGGEPSSEGERGQWRQDLDALLSGSENMTALVGKPLLRGREAGGNGHSDGDDDYDDDGGGFENVSPGDRDNDDTAVQERMEGGESAGCLEEAGAATAGQELTGRARSDLDFSEKLWEIMARAPDAESARVAVAAAFRAVQDESMFPVIGRDNQTAIGRLIREAVAMAREARYRDGAAMGVGAARDEAAAKAWLERSGTILGDTAHLAEAFVELGLYKVSRDVVHWFEVHAGVLAADVERILSVSYRETPSASAVGSKPSSSPSPPSVRTAECDRIERLIALADTIDVVATALSFGTPWRQARFLALAGLAALGSSALAAGAGDAAAPSHTGTFPVFPVAMPKPLPPRARAKLAHPLFWELFVGSPGAGRSESSAGSLAPTKTLSYALANVGLFQPKGVDEPPVLSAGASRAAQAALKGCPAHLVAEVLSSVAGVDSLAELRRRHQERRAREMAGTATTAEAVEADDTKAVFLCEHRFSPW